MSIVPDFTIGLTKDEPQTFSPRTGVDRLALILDGDWSDRHLQTLSSSGWDIIVYPDEILQLVSQL